MLLKVGFHRAAMTRYTGFKSSPYTEGALFYGEKLVVLQASEVIQTQAEPLVRPGKDGGCEPGPT